MGKLGRLSSIRSMAAPSFAYVPPDRVYGVIRVLLTVGEGVDAALLRTVIRGLRRFSSPTAVLFTRAELLAGDPLLDDAFVKPVDLDVLPMRLYQNLAPDSEVERVKGPTLLVEVDGVIAVGVFTGTDPAAPSLDVLRGLVSLKGGGAPGPVDAYGSIGDRFVGAVLRVGDQVVWGDDLLGVDIAACTMQGLTPPLSLAAAGEIDFNDPPPAA